jgi:hypothetical protein
MLSGTVRTAVLLLLILLTAPSGALGQTGTGSVTPCDDPLYRQLLLREVESMTSAERSYLAESNYACADYLRAVQVVRMYVDDRPPPRFFKDPQLAQALAVPIPGGGHIYSGESVVGVALLLGTAAAATTGLLLSECHWGADYCEPVVLGVGLGAASIFWLIGIVDAPASAARVNASRGR